MDMKTENIPSYKIAYIRKVGPYGYGNVQAMDQLKSWAKSNHILDDQSIILEIAHDNPDTTKPEDCRYDTCIVVAEDYLILEEKINLGRISGGKYAVFVIPHTAEAVQKAWGEIFPELQMQGCVFDTSRPILERYQAEMIRENFCEICVPMIQ